ETGWIHGVDEDIESKRLPKDEAPKLSVEQLTRIAVRMYEHERAARTRENLAESLGVSLSSLDLLRVGYGMDRWGREFASFPARDERGRVVGIVRRYPDGKKLSWEGGSTGLFYERGWHKRTGPVLIVEGASDVAACISAGLPAIGRPSNTGGVDRIAAMLKRHNRRAVVIGEDDEDPSKRGQTQHCPEDCTGCLKCYPGKVGVLSYSREGSCYGVCNGDLAIDFTQSTPAKVVVIDGVRYVPEVAFAVKPDGFHTDEDHPHPHDIVARLVPDTGAERALRLLRELNDKLEAGVHLSLSWCVTVWECELHEDDGSVDLGEKSPRSVFVACEPTPLAAVEAAAKALGVELGEGE
ncbi:Uncharacterized protein SCF082_LOCUS43412, partial [Durusdinium trenchii]